MKSYKKYIIFSLTALLLSFVSYTQVSINATVNRHKILIGEPIQLTIEAYTPLGAAIQWFNPDSIPGFEIISRSGLDTVQNIDGKKTVQTFTITAFDSGYLQIPPFEITVDGNPYYSDSVAINAAFISFDPKEDYHEIKDIIKPIKKTNYIPWIIALITLIALVVIFYIIRKKKKVTVAAAPAPKLSPYEDALKSLKELQKTGIAKGEKYYYTTMNDIVRKYVSGKFKVTTFERTNEELIMQLNKMNIPKEAFGSLSESLRIADFVKFAKFRPTEEDNNKNFAIVHNSIKVLENSVNRAV